jgi:hypothetical protein
LRSVSNARCWPCLKPPPARMVDLGKSAQSDFRWPSGSCADISLRGFVPLGAWEHGASRETLKKRFSSATRTNTTQRNIERGNLKTLRQRNARERFPRRDFDIGHFPAPFAEKMTMLPHIRAKARGTPIQRHLPEQPAPDEHTEAIINRRKRNLRHPPLDAFEDFVRCRMIPTIRHDFENFAALAGKTEACRLERMLQPLTKFSMFERGNIARRVTFQAPRVNRACVAAIR